ncbi:MAG: DUF975 family protein [Candidatus Obscuribacterales bacterium]|nr:DUF975 family protein [Candidatus Obscuribacterales bacterium]
MAKFSIAESLEVGWDIAKNNFVILLGAFVITLLSGLLPFAAMVIFTNVIGPDSFVSQIFAAVATFGAVILWCGLGMGWLKMSLDLIDKRPGDFSQLFSCFPLIFSGVVASLIAGIAFQIGSFFLLVPGIIIFIKLQFYPFFIVEEGCGPIEALQKSWEITKGVKWQLFLFDLVMHLMNVLGSLCFGVGVFVTAPITLVAGAFVFRKLQASSQETNAQTPSPVQ